MRLFFIGGTHPRHLYYFTELAKDHRFAGAILQDRGSMLPEKPAGLSGVDDFNWDRHFRDRATAEQVFFGRPEVPEDIETLRVSAADLESQKSIDFVESASPDLVLIFGCGLIRHGLADALPELSINLHLGLSPWYRGASTLFWPFYNLEPQYAGFTFHKIVDEADAGDILHQERAPLVRGDGIHITAAKAVAVATGKMRRLLYRSPSKWNFTRQTQTGKNYLSRDFKPQMLRMIYQEYNNDIVDQYLDGKFGNLGNEPKLVKQI